MNKPPNGHIYPKRYFDASPTWFAWNKLTAADIQALRREVGFEGQDVFFHLNHPFRYVDVVGLVVQVDLVPNCGDKFTLLYLDDGSGGLVEVKIVKRQVPDLDTAEYPSNTEVDNLDVRVDMGLPVVSIDRTAVPVGTIIRVKGDLGLFRHTVQVRPKRVYIIKSTTEEVVHWSKMVAFKDSVLKHPWVLDERRRNAIDEEMARRALKDRVSDQRRKTRDAEHEAKRRRHLERSEAKRALEQEVMDQGALPGSNLLPKPWA